MPRVIYSTRLDAFRDVCEQPQIYIAPKERIPLLKSLAKCKLIAVEDIAKTETWLWLNEAVQRGTPMVYDRVARYYKVGSDKSRKLAQLAEASGSVSLVDIVPFCEDVKFLYMTWRYIDRTILGHAHFYAFSGGHAEMFRGQIVASLDPVLLCHKIRRHCLVDATPSLKRNRETVRLEFTSQEHEAYQAKRDELFAGNRTPQPILTRLADTSHAFATRRDTVRDLLRSCDGDVAVICNLQDYAAEYAAVSKHVHVGTYSKLPKKLAQCETVIFAEPPIVYTYKRFDIESELHQSARLVDVRGDVKVDTFLCDRMEGERHAVSGFMDILRQEEAKA